ncbi:uncharacterized protein LOC110234386 [Exaiptasia diaphana]|uniref:Uncharacterized protein n=1 Tax=Exaiptasia diaphana TaxID=2652724 RepID=A0A913WX02_EXADI|nr:uncharacterized protein LOC110234386 [Exaiptasia diaphana]KXJ27720.1 hypothetical protein AC249_AIPGENE16847 [Exaiptasia diaphana]
MMSSEGLSLEEEIEQEIENFQIDSDEDQAIMKEKLEDDFVSDSINVTTNSLLRATICELERALKDTRRLLFDRDKDNGALRQELERTRKDLRREQSQRKKQHEENEKKLTSYNEIVKINEQMKDEIEELKTQLESRTARDDEDTDDIVPCCSSMNELIEMKQKVKNIEKEFEDFKANNHIQEDYSLSSFKNKVNLVSNPADNKQAQKELQTQLRIKFLRDAFFYYMIDFHPDEQMKAILAILDYDDKRHDIIIESHKMKRQGKKFIVSEVSSRSLTFVQEHQI